MKLPSVLKAIAGSLQQKDAKAIVVGGAVRDHFLELPSKDYDIEVYGLKRIKELENILSAYGSVNFVGRSFGVLKLHYEGEEYDFSFPRTEVNTGKGHQDFEVNIDGTLEYKQAAKRRDFTLNALGYDILNEKFIDPFDGLKDIKEKVLRHIDDATFTEDPLRVYRAIQFAARFGYRLADETFVLCQRMVEEKMLDALPKERIYIEWKKLLLKSPKPSIGFKMMKELGILKHYFPELYAIVDIPQSPKWHPEGDVWVHTLLALDTMQKELGVRSGGVEMQEKQKLKFLFAILCHDLGKATHTTIEEDRRIRSIGHEKAGVEPAKSLLYRLTDEHDFIKSILPLVEHHLKPSQFYKGKAKASAIRRLATKINIEELVMVAKADFLGRTTKEALKGVYDAGEWLLKKAQELEVKNEPLPALLQGKDLIALGLKPSPEFKTILNRLYSLQLEGKIKNKEEALAYVQRL